jgi:Putative zinc-finger
MNTQTDHSDSWEQCPSGVLQGLSKRSQRRRMVKRATWAIPLTVLLFFALTLNGTIPMPFNLYSGPLMCDQVVKLLPAYASNSLSATQRGQVELHLKKCPFCRDKLEAIRAKQSVATRWSPYLSHPVVSGRQILTL